MADFLNIFICIAAPLVLMFLVISDKKSKLLVLFMILGMAAGVISGFANSFIGGILDMSSLEKALYLAPVVEEILKALPIVIYFYIAKPNLKELLAFGIAVGVGFATLENITYLFAYGASDIGFILIRGFATGVMHCLTISLAAFVLSLISTTKMTSVIGLIGVIACASTYHGIYNLLVNGSGFYVTAGYLLPICTAAVYLLMLKGPRETVLKKILRR